MDPAKQALDELEAYKKFQKFMKRKMSMFHHHI